MKTLVVASQKGGVGKTTLALNLSLAFAEAGFRTVLVDTDPQGAIGLSLSKKVASLPGLADCIAGEIELGEALVQTKVEGFSLLPVGQIAPQEAHPFASAVADGQRLRAVIDQLAQMNFDLAVVDTPCGFGGITLGALRAATHVVSPIQAEPIALRSVTQLLEMIRSLADQGVQARVAGFVISMLQNDVEASARVAREIWEMFPRELLFDASVPRDPLFLEATEAGVPLGLLRQPPPAVTHVFRMLAADLSMRMNLQPPRRVHGPRTLVD